MTGASKAEKARVFKKRVNALLSAESKAYLSRWVRGSPVGFALGTGRIQAAPGVEVSFLDVAPAVRCKPAVCRVLAVSISGTAGREHSLQVGVGAGL